MRDAGVIDEFDELVQRGEMREAVRLLDRADVNYAADRRTGSMRSEVGTQDVWDEQDSTIWLVAGEVDDPVYRAINYWNLELDPYSGPDCADPPDGSAISYPEDRWGFEPGSEDLDGMSSNFDPNPEGCIAEFDDQQAYNDLEDDNGGHLRIDLEKQETGEHTIYGHYSHTWRTLCLPGGVSFGIAAGAFSVSVSGSAGKWKHPTPTVEI